MAVDDGMGGGFGGDVDFDIAMDEPGRYVFDVAWGADDAVGVVSGEVGGDEVVGDAGGFVLGAGGGAEDGGDEGGEGVGGDDAVVGGHGGGLLVGGGGLTCRSGAGALLWRSSLRCGVACQTTLLVSLSMRCMLDMSAARRRVWPGMAMVSGSTRAQTGSPLMKKCTMVSMPIGSVTSTRASR